MQLRTRAGAPRPLSALLSNGTPTSETTTTTATTTTLGRSTSSSTLPAAPGAHSAHHTPIISTDHHHIRRRGSLPHPSISESNSTSDVPHMPLLSSASATPTARPSQHSLNTTATARSECSSFPSTPNKAEQPTSVSSTTAMTTTPPARPRSLSNPMAMAENPDGERSEDNDSNRNDDSDWGENAPPRQYRRHSSSGSPNVNNNSAGRLPAMLQPSKLTFGATPLPSSSSCALTSPARTASQPDVNALSVTSPARRCCITGGSSQRNNNNNNGSNSNRGSSMSSVRAERRSAAAVTTTTSETCDPNVGSPPIPPPSPPSPLPSPASHNAAPTTTSTRRTTSGSTTSGRYANNGNSNRQRQRATSVEANTASGDAYLRENPRVRTLVNNLYQHVLTVQPADPLHYLAQLNPGAILQPPSTATSGNDAAAKQRKQHEQQQHSDEIENGEREKENHEVRSTAPTQQLYAFTNTTPQPNSLQNTHPPSTPTRDDEPTGTAHETTATDTRRSSEHEVSDTSTAPVASSAKTMTLPPQQQQQQLLRPPRSRPSRLATPRTIHNTSTSNNGSVVASTVAVSAHSHSSPVQPLQGRCSNSLESGNRFASNPPTQNVPTTTITTATTTAITAATAAAVSNTTPGANNSGGNAESTPLTSAPTMTAPSYATGTLNSGSAGSVINTDTSNNNPTVLSNNRAMRAPPPSAPSPSLATRLTSAGSPATTANPRNTFGSASLTTTTLNSKLGSSFHLQRTSFHTTNTGSGGNVQMAHGLGSGVNFANYAARGMVSQTSFVGSQSGLERGEVTPSEASSLFSTNSVDLQEFITEFRLAKEECCGGSIECPNITLDDLAAIIEKVSFPFPDGAALLDLFEELQPCTRYWMNGDTSVLENTTSTGAANSGSSTGPSLACALGSGQNSYRLRDVASGAAITSSVAAAAASTVIDGPGKQRINGGASNNSNGNNRGNVASAAFNMSAATAVAATQRNGLSDADDCADQAVARHWGAEAMLPVKISPDKYNGTDASASLASSRPTNTNTTAAAAAAVTGGGTASSVEAYSMPASIPTPPPLAKVNPVGGASTMVTTVPFDTFTARMAFKIQGRYSAEAIRIAFYGMIVDDDATTVTAGIADGGSAPTASAAARGMLNVLSTDSLTPSEPAGTTCSSVTTLNYVHMPSCTVPLLRCLTEGLYARLGMVDVTSSDVQRGVRSAGLPTAPDEQRTCECHLEDFARLVRAVTTVADRGFSVSPGNLCLSSLRDNFLQRGASTTSRKEEAASAPSRVNSGFPLQTVRYL